MTVRIHGALRHALAGDVGRLTQRIEAGQDGLPTLAAPETINPGLLLNRLWLDARDDDELQTALQAAQLRAVATACRQLPAGLLPAVHQRRAVAAQALAGRRPGWTWRAVLITPWWRLVLGHGEDSVHESGLTLSPTYGVPVLPGTALKGLAAAAARDAGWSEPDLTVFGAPRPDLKADARRGSVLIWDAWPVDPPRLVLDVLTPHVKDYYDTANATGTPGAAPAEYHNPVPVRFLAVEQTRFRTYLLGPPGEVTHCVELLRRGLDELGIGGKTAAGYGYCVCRAEEP